MLKSVYFYFEILYDDNAKGGKGFADIEVCKASMTVGSFSLMRSDFGRHGAVYTEIWGVELNRI